MGWFSNFLDLHPRVKGSLGFTSIAAGVVGEYVAPGSGAWVATTALGAAFTLQQATESGSDLRHSGAERAEAIDANTRARIDSDLRPLEPEQRDAYVQRLGELARDPEAASTADPGPGGAAAELFAVHQQQEQATEHRLDYGHDYAQQLQAESYASLGQPQPQAGPSDAASAAPSTPGAEQVGQTEPEGAAGREPSAPEPRTPEPTAPEPTTPEPSTTTAADSSGPVPDPGTTPHPNAEAPTPEQTAPKPTAPEPDAPAGPEPAGPGADAPAAPAPASEPANPQSPAATPADRPPAPEPEPSASQPTTPSTAPAPEPTSQPQPAPAATTPAPAPEPEPGASQPTTPSTAPAPEPTSQPQPAPAAATPEPAAAPPPPEPESGPAAKPEEPQAGL